MKSKNNTFIFVNRPICPYVKPTTGSRLENSIKSLRKLYNNNSNSNTNSIPSSEKKNNSNWKEAKFEILQQAQKEDNDIINANNIEEEGISTQPLPQLEFGTGTIKSSFGIGVQQNDIFTNKTESKIAHKNSSNTMMKTVSNFPNKNNKSKLPRPGTSPIKKANSTSKFTTVKNKPLSIQQDNENNINRTKSQFSSNNKLPEEHFEELSKLIIEQKKPEDILSNKLEEFNKEIQKLRAENSRVSKLREDYEKLNLKLQKDMKEFNVKKEQEIMQFEAFKEEETKKLAKERKQLTQDQRTFNEIRNKNQASQMGSKKDKELIEQLKSQLAKCQEDAKIKDNSNKHLIEKYKKQLEDANNKIIELNTLLTKLNTAMAITNNQNVSLINQKHSISKMNQELPSFQPPEIQTNINDFGQPMNQLNKTPNFVNISNSTKSKNLLLNKFPTTKEEEEDEDENFDLVFPDKYHKNEYILLKTENGNDGKIIKYYNNDKKEIIFKSGVRKEVFGDGYIIVYFNNGDLKQIFPNQKTVYYFNEAKTIQTTYPDKLQVFKFENGQIEKHYPDGTKQIAFPDGSLRYILPDGYEETYYLDGKVQKIDKNGVITLEHEDGYKEIKYPDGREVCEYDNNNNNE